MRSPTVDPSPSSIAPEAAPAFGARQFALAAVAYLIIIVSGVGGEGFVRAPMVLDADPGVTTANLLAGAEAFRWSVLADVVMVLADVAIGVLLWAWLSRVDRTLAMLAMTLRLAQAAVLTVNLGHLVGAVTLADPSLAPGLVEAQRHAMVAASLRAHAVGYDLGLFLFGVDCVVVGWLLWRGRLAPPWLAGVLGGAGVVYLVGSGLTVVAPGSADAFAPAYALPLLAELAFCGWLAVEAWRQGAAAARASSKKRAR